MTIYDGLSLFTALLSGIMAGGLYFFVMWKSINRYQKDNKLNFFVFSFFLRLIFLLSFLYFFANNQAVKYLIFMGGFFLSKFIAVRVSRKMGEA